MVAPGLPIWAQPQGDGARPPEAPPEALSAKPPRGRLAQAPARASLGPSETPSAKPPRDPAQKKRRRRVVVISTLAAVLVAVVGSGAFGLYHFSQRAKPGVTLFGQSVAGQTAQELRSTLQAIDQAFRANLTADGTTLSADADDVGLAIDVDRSVQAALAAGGGEHPWVEYNPWKEKAAPGAITVDQARLQAYLDGEFVSADQKTVEPAVMFDEAANQFTAKPSRTGVRTQVGPVVAAFEAFARGERAASDAIAVTTEVDQPFHSDDSAEQAAATANARLGLQLVLNNGQTGWGERSYQITPQQLASWTDIVPNQTTGAFDVTLDDAQAKADLLPILNREVADPMVPNMVVMDPDSPDEVLGYNAGEPGTAVADMDATWATVKDAVEHGQSLTHTVALVEVPMTDSEGLPPTNFDEPNGAKWIDVNKSTFLATAYEGTTQVNQFVISIGRGGEFETTDGTFYVYLKYSDQTMCGGTGNVPSPDGRSGGPFEYCSDVTWVSYFNTDIGFHQADWNTWQGTWGQRVSHGCVNMRGEDAKWIFDWSLIGTKVVVHY
jgi:lipoprotein-anchoring transpeptidase ErfK/SrfK